MASYLPPILHEGSLNSTYYNDGDFNYQNSTSSVSTSSNTNLKLTGVTVSGPLISNGVFTANNSVNINGSLIAAGTLSVAGLFTANGGTQINGSHNVTGTSTCQTSSVTGSETVGGSSTVTGISYANGGLTASSMTNNGAMVMSVFSSITANTTLSASSLVQMYFVNAATPITINLPAPSAVTAGTQINFRRMTSGANGATITTTGGTSCFVAIGSTTSSLVTSLSLTVFNVTLISNGISWICTQFV